MAGFSETRNFYADHLAALNKSNKAIATQDILNDDGVVVVTRNKVLTSDMADKIARFKLLKPLENSVALENTISPKQLFLDLMQTHKMYEDMGGPPAKNITDILKKQCLLYGKYPLLTQKLTVLSERLPQHYQNAQISAIFALHVALELGLTDTQVHAVFIAAQMHDTGLLNIDPAIVDKTGKLKPSEWKTLQGHTVIGKYLMDMIPGLPKSVGIAVMQHHERLDGTGYPHGKTAEKLSVEGQIIAISDMMIAIFTQRLEPLGYLFKDLTPILQMNAPVYPQEIHQAVMRIMQRSPLAPSRVLEDSSIGMLISLLLVSQKIIAHCFDLVHVATKEIGELLQNEHSQRAIYMLERLQEIMDRSGLFSAELREWLNGVNKKHDTEDYQEVEYIALMFDEFGYQLSQLHKLTSTAASSLDDSWIKKCAELGEFLDKIPKHRLLVVQECASQQAKEKSKAGSAKTPQKQVKTP